MLIRNITLGNGPSEGGHETCAHGEAREHTEAGSTQGRQIPAAHNFALPLRVWERSLTATILKCAPYLWKFWWVRTKAFFLLANLCFLCFVLQCAHLRIIFFCFWDYNLITCIPFLFSPKCPNVSLPAPIHLWLLFPPICDCTIRCLNIICWVHIIIACMFLGLNEYPHLSFYILDSSVIYIL